MSALNSKSLMYGAKCALAAILALYIAFSLALTNPTWAILTTFITSLPLAGAVRAKAFFRIAGTVVGASAALIFTVIFSTAPELFFLVLSLWVGICLYLSLLNRTPSGYAFMLAGYSASIIGFTAINDPSIIFDTALARAEEITIGTVCAVLVHSLIFPVSVSGAIYGKLNATFNDAKGWVLAALCLNPEENANVGRRRLASDLTELNLMSVNFKFEVTTSRKQINTIRALEERMIALLPLLGGVEDRLAALKATGDVPETLIQLIQTVRDWVAEHALDPARPVTQDEYVAYRHQAKALIEACHALVPTIDAGTPWRDLLMLNLITRLADLISSWADSLSLFALIHHPRLKPTPAIKAMIAVNRQRPLHVDRGVALVSGVTVFIATMLCVGFCMLIEWPQGLGAAALVSVMCSLFSAFDDPTVFQAKMLRFFIYAIPLSALYSFGVFPMLTSFPMFALVLFPVLVLIGAFMASPIYGLPALAFALNFITGISIQDRLNTDFISFVTANISSIVALLFAILVTSLIRVIRSDVSIRRILHAGWRELAEHATGHLPKNQSIWASRMLDRLGLLIPKLLNIKDDTGHKVDDALKDLPLGYNIIDLRLTASRLPPVSQSKVQHMMVVLHRHFMDMVKHGFHAPDQEILDAIDEVIHDLVQIEPLKSDLIFPYQHASTIDDLKLRGVIAAVGLRRYLFPEGIAYQPQGVLP